MNDKELDKYLATECFKPRRIVNKYTHETMYVRCGTCPACMAHKSNIQCAYITNMASHFKYAYFFTLTYSDEFLPRVSVRVAERLGVESEVDAYVSDDDVRHLSKDDNFRYSCNFDYIIRSNRVCVSRQGRDRILSDTDEPYSFMHDFSVSEVQDILVKSHGKYDPILKRVVYPKLSECSTSIPVLNSYDQNLFFKRLRFHLSKISDEKICYYLVSEYGPRTFRPHWHGILFFNSDKISEVICEYVYKSWLYGRADCSLSRGSAAGYVASYINSFVGLPDFYIQHKEIKPRSYHSKGFGSYSKFPKTASVSEVQQVANLLYDGVSADANGEFITIRPTRSYERDVFPRFFDDAFKDPHRCADLFLATSEVPFRLCRYGYLSVDEMNVSTFTLATRYSEWYYDYILNAHYYNNLIIDRKDGLIIHFLRLDSIQVDFDCVVGKFYRLLSRVKRFMCFWSLENLCSYDLSRSLYKIFSASVDYWSRKDARTLSMYFEYLEKRPLSIPFIYQSTVNAEPISSNKDCKARAFEFLSSLKSSVKMALNRKIKHKEFNDLSGLLLNF